MKPKREITLGEMQDECKKRGCECEHKCPYFGFCGDLLARSPSYWNLTDPPRFTEAQMALLKALWENGAKKIKVCGMGIVALNEKGLTIYLADILREIEGETLELAELFGKEGER